MRILTVVCFLACGALSHPAHAQPTAGSSGANAASLDCLARKAALPGQGTTMIETAGLMPGNPMPPFPPGGLRRFVVSVVVDTLGRADAATLQVPAGVDSAMTNAMRSVFPAWRFIPARVGGCPVKQVVRVTFTR